MSVEVLARWAPWVDRLVLLAAVSAALAVGWQAWGVWEARKGERIEMPELRVEWREDQ